MRAFRHLARAMHSFLFVPEYNHGYPGLLKHALDTDLKEYIHKAWKSAAHPRAALVERA